MSIRKYGNEPAKVETRAEDNDRETLEKLAALAQEAVDKSKNQDQQEQDRS
jgi:hypothetical protein